MRRYVAFAIGAIIFLIIGFIQQQYISILKQDRDKYRSNTHTLLDSVKHYKVNDSLNAVSVKELNLTLSEYKNYRAQDLALINLLAIKGRDIEGVTTSELKSLYKLIGTARDTTIIIRDTIDRPVEKPVKHISIKDKWYSFNGYLDAYNNFSGDFISKDSLLYVETVKYKRFLGFLWKTKKIKDRKQDIISKNPHTEILNAEFITVEK